MAVKKRGKIGQALLKMFFPKTELRNIVSTFGKNVYHIGPIPPEIYEHELVHVKQQRNALRAIVWWARYIISARFRYSQELPAYRRQIEFASKGKSLNAVYGARQTIAKILSGPTYNHMVSYDQALKDLCRN